MGRTHNERATRFAPALQRRHETPQTGGGPAGADPSRGSRTTCLALGNPGAHVHYRLFISGKQRPWRDPIDRIFGRGDFGAPADWPTGVSDSPCGRAGLGWTFPARLTGPSLSALSAKCINLISTTTMGLEL